MKSLTRYAPDDPLVRIHGRTRSGSPLPLFWTASGVEFLTDAATVFLELEVTDGPLEQWVRIELDSAELIRCPLFAGKHKICVFHDLPAGTPRQVRLFKETQPLSKDSLLLVRGILTDGVLLPLPKRTLRIEFIGDSLTAGEGLCGANSLAAPGAPIVYSSRCNYAVETARRLDADIHIEAMSGWGVYCGWNNDPHLAMPRYYRQICGTVSGGTYRQYGGDDAWNFAGWQPDIVVIGLGSNDGFAMDHPAWVDPDDGKAYQQGRSSDRTPEPASAIRLSRAVKDFLSIVRKPNPQAQIVWVYGMVGQELNGTIQQAIAGYKEETSDICCHYLTLPGITSWEQLASNNHPGSEVHLRAADCLTEYLRQLI